MPRAGRQTDLPGYRRWTLRNFSGTLCVDELHLGHRSLLLATDPVGDFPVAFALVSANDQDHMGRFLDNLRQHGFWPRVVVTDGSNLYPALLAELWPHARHQICVFHVLQDINTRVFDALLRLRCQHARKGGRRRRRGRPSKAQRRTRARRGPTRKEQAYFVWKHRHLLVTRPERLNGRERHLLRVCPISPESALSSRGFEREHRAYGTGSQLSHLFRYVPASRMLRAFVLRIYRLFAPDQRSHQAACRRAALVNDPQYRTDPDLARALALLSPDKFDKMVAFLHRPTGHRVRTNNHVERTNRRLRYFEKVRYKWRRRRTIVRFVVLALECWRHRRLAAGQSDSLTSQKPTG